MVPGHTIQEVRPRWCLGQERWWRLGTDGERSAWRCARRRAWAHGATAGADKAMRVADDRATPAAQVGGPGEYVSVRKVCGVAAFDVLTQVADVSGTVSALEGAIEGGRACAVIVRVRA